QAMTESERDRRDRGESGERRGARARDHGTLAERRHQIAVQMDPASRSWRHPVDDMKKRARYRALSHALFRHFGVNGIPAIDQRIAARGNRARIVELVAEHFRSLRTERAGRAKPRAPIAQMQPSVRKGSL